VTGDIALTRSGGFTAETGLQSAREEKSQVKSQATLLSILARIIHFLALSQVEPTRC
jgi:hypothetical protein